MALLEFERVTKVYGAHEAEVHALDGVNLQVEAGEFELMVGSSAAPAALVRTRIRVRG